MKQVLFATTNPSKVKRFKEKLLKYDIELLCLKDVNIKNDCVEDGSTAIENALIKARSCAKLTNMPVLAMDDTLYIDDIPDNLQPGLYVRRVNGKVLTDEEAINYYTNLVRTYGKDDKLMCKWIYGMALIYNGREYTYTWSLENSYIVNEPSKVMNPGYPFNSITKNKKNNMYYSEMTFADKAKVDEDESDVIEFIINSTSSMC